MILLDTHAWIWFVDNPGHLSPVARRAVDEELRDRGPLLISSMSAWEVAMLHQRGRLALTSPVDL